MPSGPSCSSSACALIRLVKYTDRDDLTAEERKEYEAIAAIHAQLQRKRKHVDTTDLMVEINGIINDISGIDFDLLRRK